MNVAPFQRFLIDTGAHYALVSPRDERHQVAVRIQARAIRERSQLLTTNFIVAESHALILNRMNRATAEAFLTGIYTSTGMTVIRVSEADEQRARDIIRQYSDKSFSFTDATSFAVMDRLGLAYAFAFDHNFEQYGKTLLAP